MIRRLVFMGTPDFAAGALRSLIDSGKYEICGVFTQPDKPKGRGKNVQMTPVKEIAVSCNIPVFQPVRIRDDESYKILEDLRPDVIVVVAFGQIIPKKILDLPPYGCINVHASLLPAYRGAAPIQWAVINGEKESGVTIMKMDEGLDTGDMIRKKTVALAPDETGGSLFDKLSDVGAGLLLETLEDLSCGRAQFEKQPEKSPTPYASMLKKEQGRIDWTRSADELERLVRGLNPWPSAYTSYRGKTLKIWRAVPGTSEASAAPGSAVLTDKHTLHIRTGEGDLVLLEVQPEGKKRMSIDAFLRGYPVEDGESFGE